MEYLDKVDFGSTAKCKRSLNSIDLLAILN